MVIMQRKKSCMNKQIQNHFLTNFDDELPAEVGLAGRQRIFAQFKIDPLGKIIDILVRAPHPRLEKETKRVLRLLPKMKPGKQRGQPVTVVYALPLTLMVEE